MSVLLVVTGSDSHSRSPAAMTSQAADVRVGTASWTEKTLLESRAFYPPTARTAEERLRFYATRFRVVEVDATYYALPSARNAAAWAARTPDDFLFGVKAFAAMTGHPVEPVRLDRDLQAALPAPMRRARQVAAAALPSDVRDEIWRRFADNLAPLVAARKLAYVLLQLPPWCRPSEESRVFVEDAAARLGVIPAAVEFREQGWLADAEAASTFAWLRRKNLAYVCVDEPQGTRASVPPIAEATSPDLAVVRFHGRRAETWTRPNVGTTERFRYHYTNAELAEWLPRIRTLANSSRRVLALMNNCHRTAAVTNAADLATLLTTD
jgi:uncharacterized protein YecE (DUF72 family)